MESFASAASLPRRWDPAWVERRLQVERARRDAAGLPPDAAHPPLAGHYRALEWALRAGGLYRRGYRNFRDIQLRHLSHELKGWPSALDGFRILQLSDLHLDLDPALVAAILGALQAVEAEMAVITGDFWEGLIGHAPAAERAIRDVISTLRMLPFGVYGVLGNHDTLATGSLLESIRLPILCNEAVQIGEGPAAFALAGVDDAYFYRTSDIRRAAGACPAGLPRILLSHSPQLGPAAAQCGFALTLSGHTHGGQVCLPGGWNLFPMRDVPRRLFRGLWQAGPMPGYTTTGTGASHVPVRFNCPPEIVLHCLRSG
jgi:predicted MPP superfamily phosphohydrolase